MSKPNKFNRTPNKPDFKEIPQSGAQNKTSAPGSQKPELIVFDPDEDSDSSFFAKYNFRSIGTFFGGCWGKLAAGSKSAVSKTWGGICSAGQWTWGGLRHIASYCVIRDTEAKDETELPVTPPKAEPAKVVGKTEGKKQTTPVKIEYDEDEDELDVSRWWSIGIKTAAVAAMVLILVGGYFAVKPLLTKSSTEMAAVAESENLQSTNDAANEVHDIKVAAVPEYIPAIPSEIPVPIAKPESPKPELSALNSLARGSPSQGSLFENDPFFAQSVAEAAPPVANDPFATATVAKEETTPTLVALQPLSVLKSTDSAQTAQLQPLATLKSSAFSSVEVANAPVPATASADAPVAGNFADRRTQRNSRNNATFSQAPTPPVVNTISQTTVQQTLPVIEPIKEIIPQIPFSGTVQDVPPPVPSIAEVSLDRAAYGSESTPAIPKDGLATVASDLQSVPNTVIPAKAGIQMEDVNAVLLDPRLRGGDEKDKLAGSPVVPVYANEPAPAIPKDAPVTGIETADDRRQTAADLAGTPAVEFSPRILSSDSQPIDRQLRERLQALRGESDVAPSNLRFESVTAASEPTLRFTPKRQPPPAITDGGLLGESVSSLQGLLPSSPGAAQGTSRSEIASLETNAPKPVRAVAAPAYRNDQAEGERGMTFQSRIDSEIKRSPSEAETYTVQQGDTYMTISDQFYGTSLLYTALAAHNQQLGIGWRPTEGVVIEVPTAEYLRTHYGGQKPLLVAQSSGVRYVVQEGDTVFRLATDKLQDSTRWREIYAINSDRFQDVRDLKPGMEILLPDKKL